MISSPRFQVVGCCRWFSIFVFTYAGEAIEALKSSRSVEGTAEFAEGYDYDDAIDAGR